MGNILPKSGWPRDIAIGITAGLISGAIIGIAVATGVVVVSGLIAFVIPVLICGLIIVYRHFFSKENQPQIQVEQQPQANNRERPQEPAQNNNDNFSSVTSRTNESFIARGNGKLYRLQEMKNCASCDKIFDVLDTNNTKCKDCGGSTTSVQQNQESYGYDLENEDDVKKLKEAMKAADALCKKSNLSTKSYNSILRDISQLSDTDYTYIVKNIKGMYACPITEKPLYLPDQLPCGHNFDTDALSSDIKDNGCYCYLCGKKYEENQINRNTELVAAVRERARVLLAERPAKVRATPVN